METNNITLPTPAVRPVWDGMPAALKELASWVVWKLSPKAGSIKLSKVPYDAKTGQKASSTDPNTWSPFEVARSAYEAPLAQGIRPFAGVGLALAPSGGLFAVDLDGCIDPDTGEVEPWAQTIISEMHTYTELSPGGKGVHMFARGTLPPGRRKQDRFEVYSEDRYMTVTGKRVLGTPDTIDDRTAEIARIHARLFSLAPETPRSTPAYSHADPAPPPSDTVGAGDNAVLAACLAGRNGQYMRSLMDGDITRYDDDQSCADLALCSLIAKKTSDASQIGRLFRRSKLMRGKWDEMHGAKTYGQATVERALSPAAGASGTEGGAPPSEDGSDKDWPIPVTLGEIFLPGFPVEALPAALADQCREVAQSVQVPMDLPAMMGLGAVAAAGSGRCVVKVGRSFIAPTNLYVVAVQPPSARKSATLNLMGAPIREADRQMRAASKQAMAANKTQRALEEKQFAVLQKRLERAAEEETASAMAEAAAYAATMTPPLCARRLLLDDVTMEKLGQIIAEQTDNTVAIFSAEGGVLAIMGGLYSKGTPNLDLVLKAYTGEAYNADRLGREEASAPHPIMTLALAVQPAVIQSMADDDAFRGRGVISRMLFSNPASLVGTRMFADRQVDPEVHARYGRTVAAIFALASPASLEDPGARHELRLEGDALAVWARYADAVEQRMGEGGDLAVIEDWAGKLPGAVARIAGCLHLVEHAEGGSPWDIPISNSTVAAAWAIGDYLIPHALNIYGMMGADRVQTLARRMLGWIKRRDLTVFSLRDWNRQHQDLRADDVQSALEVLQELGYLREVPVPRNGDIGRKPLPTYTVNPRWCPPQVPHPNPDA